MKRFLLITKFLLVGATATMSQSVAINNTGSQPNASAILDLSSATKGLLIPRMTIAQRTAIVTPATGLQVYQTDSTQGIYYYSGSVWMHVGTAGTTYSPGTGITISGSALSAKNTTALWNANQLQGKAISTTAPQNGQVLQYDLALTKWVPITPAATSWSLKGNGAINPATDFIGTTDAQPFIGKANGQQVFRFSPATTSTIIGYQAGYNNITGGDKNHFIGYQAGFSNTGFNNHFDGYQAGFVNGSGYSNQFIGFQAGHANSSGNDNLFIGVLAGYSNTVSSGNHFVGNGAGFSNTTGIGNHFSGFDAGESNTTGSYNYFEGNHAGFSNTTGNNNFFQGNNAGYANAVASDNYFSGNNAGKANITGNSNVFIGKDAGIVNVTGSNNVFNGFQAGFSNVSGRENVFVGYSAGYNNTAGYGNIFLGNNAGKNEKGNNRLYIGSQSLYSTGLLYGELDNYYFRVSGNQEIKAAKSTGIPLLTLTSYGGEDPKLKFQPTNDLNESWLLNSQPYGPFSFWHNGKEGMRLYGDGTLVVDNYVIELSDKTLKRNIVPLKSSLQKLMKLGAYTYNWLDKTKSEKDQIGLIAQEVETQFPQLVFTDKDGIKGVAYTHMVPVLLESIKEQQVIIDELKTENTQIKKEIAAIKSKIGL